MHLDATSCSTVENCVYIYISSEVHVVSRITFAESQCTEILSRDNYKNYKAEFERTENNLNHSLYKIIIYRLLNPSFNKVNLNLNRVENQLATLIYFSAEKKKKIIVKPWSIPSHLFRV